MIVTRTPSPDGIVGLEGKVSGCRMFSGDATLTHGVSSFAGKDWKLLPAWASNECAFERKTGAIRELIRLYTSYRIVSLWFLS